MEVTNKENRENNENKEKIIRNESESSANTEVAAALIMVIFTLLERQF